MENKDWRVKIGSVLNNNRVDILSKDGSELLDDLQNLVERGLDKAGEGGYEKGVKDGIKGKVFNKVEIKEEAHIPKELIEKIREEGYEKGYEMGVKYGTTGNTLTDSDTEEFERLDKKERERFLKSIY